jgi:hypothetical protein
MWDGLRVEGEMCACGCLPLGDVDVVYDVPVNSNTIKRITQRIGLNYAGSQLRNVIDISNKRTFYDGF